MENSAMSLTDQYYVDPTNYEMPDFYDFYNQYGREHSSGWIDTDPYGLAGFLEEKFRGTTSSAMNEYNRQKELKEKAFLEAQNASARKYNEYMDSSKYQRMSSDLKAAGFNPWLAVQSGLGGASVVPTYSSKKHSAQYLSNHQKVDRNDDFLANLATSAIKMLLMAAIFG